MLSKLDFVNNFHSHVIFYDVIVSTAVFRFLKKKREKKDNTAVSQGSVLTSEVFDFGVLKESFVLAYILPNTSSNIFYRHTVVQFYDRHKMLKEQKN